MNFFITPRLPLLCMAIENEFDCQKIGDQKQIQSPQD
jgi:hypothetical protein